MRVIFINRCYWPDTEATGQLLTDLAGYLAKSMEVHVVCGQPNHPGNQDFVRHGTQQHQGVTIHRLPHTTFNKRVPAGRLFNLVSFTRSAKRYLRKSQLPADVVVSETDPFLLPPVGVGHAENIGAKSVCCLQDIYPDVAEAVGKAKPGRVTRAIRGRLRDAYSRADRVIVLGSCMRDRLVQPPWGIDPDAIEILPNWADCESITPVAPEENAFRRSIADPHHFVVMHSGNMGLTQDLENLIEAAALDDWPEHAVLRIVGGGASYDRLRAKHTALQEAGLPADRVRFLPYQPREALSETLSAADLHIVSMNPNVRGCLCPSKLYGIMAAGRPTLAIADPQTDLVRTIRGNAIGWDTAPGDAETIAAEIGRIAGEPAASLRAMGMKGRELAVEKFDRRVVTRKFGEMLAGLAVH